MIVPHDETPSLPPQPSILADNVMDMSLIESFAATYQFPLDAFQREAMEHYIQGNSVLVAAPTGTGKTVVAEFAIWLALETGKRVFYTGPIKALSNQKFRDFRERYGSNNVGLMTGDIVENPTAPIIVMTTEIFRNALLELEREDHTVAITEYAGPIVSPADTSQMHRLDPHLEEVACVIFDELHFMADPQRGPVWEECIIHAPQHIQFIGLSATVQNADELVAWLSHVHGPTQLVLHPERAVPLIDYFFYREHLALIRDARGVRTKRFPHIGGELKRKSFRSRFEKRSHTTEDAVTPEQEIPEVPKPSDVLIALDRHKLLPCLFFLPGRKAAEEAALSCLHLQITTTKEQRAIEEEIDHWSANVSEDDRRLQQIRQLLLLLPMGIAYHHAGLIPPVKILVETLFSSGLLKAVFATDTLAMGVNMPARSVVLGSMSKFDGIEMRLITPNEFQQMTGRAGRRGMDTEGAAILLYSPWDEFEVAYAVLTQPLLPVRSAFSMQYNSILNLWRPHEFERLRRIGAASFLEFQRRLKRARKQSRKKRQEPANVQDLAPPTPLEDDSVEIELGSSVEHDLLATTTILRILGYIGEDDTLSLRGYLLRAIFHPAGLILSELLLSGSLDELTSTELAEVVSWFVYDSDKPLWSADTLSDRLKMARRAAKSMTDRIQHIEHTQSMHLSPMLNEHFKGVALGWAQGYSLGALRQRISLAEGDLFMLLNQTIDLLHQLESAIGQILSDQIHWNADSELSWYDRRLSRQRLERIKITMNIAARQLLHGTVAQSRMLPFTMKEPQDTKE